MPQAIIFDVEATDKNDAVIIEAASLDVTSLNPFEVGNPWVQRYNPGKPISLGALATHHIRDEELINCPASSSFRLPAGTKYLIGHNIDFDWVAIGSPEVKPEFQRPCLMANIRVSSLVKYLVIKNSGCYVKIMFRDICVKRLRQNKKRGY